MKKIIKFALGAIGVTALTYLAAREKVLLKKAAHDCSKLSERSNYEEK